MGILAIGIDGTEEGNNTLIEKIQMLQIDEDEDVMTVLMWLLSTQLTNLIAFEGTDVGLTEEEAISNYSRILVESMPMFMLR